MSENLIYANEVGNACVLVFLIAMISVFVVWVVTEIIKSIYDKKIYSCKDQIREIEKKAGEQISRMPAYLDSEVEGQEEKREEIITQRDEQIQTINEVKEKKEKRKGFVETIFNTVVGGAITVWIVSFLLMVYANAHVGGSFSAPRRVEGVTSNDVSVVMYYEISLDDVEQDTLTIFVKNDAKKPLKEATIVEKNTGTETKLNNLDFGQEKTVSMSVYSLRDSNYEFEIKDVEFYE